jgi:hypothetical protein
VEEHEVHGVAGILRADEVRERHGDALGRREAVFAVQDHRVRAVEQDDRGAGRLVVGLLDVQVGVLDVQRRVCRLRPPSVPSRAKTLESVAVMSRFSVSPNS